MPLRAYSDSGPVDNSVRPDTGSLPGKSVIVTGGANGFGEAYVRAFSTAGAFVTFGDINEAKGNDLASELGRNVQFVKCDTTSWQEQLQLFKQAVQNSPSKSVDIVIANAGISGLDDVFKLEDPTSDPTEPNLNILDINLRGVFYTFKLGQHFFRIQPESTDRDRCFIFKGSLAGYFDQPGSYQYSAAKFGLRGLMRSARRTVSSEGIRVNYVAPWYTKTGILKPLVVERLVSCGVEFSEVEDSVTAMLRIATDKTIYGRTLAIIPRSCDPHGYKDTDMDDRYDSDMWQKLQDQALAAAIRTRPPE